MPKQGRRREREARRRAAWEERAGQGRWEVVLETTDEVEWRERRGRVRTELAHVRDEDLRLDILCGRGIHPTTYRLSVLVPLDRDPDEYLRGLRA